MSTNYPTSLDSESTLYTVNNQAKTYLNGGLSTSGGNNGQSSSIDLVDGSVFPLTGNFLLIGRELIKYTTRVSNKLTGVTRGYSGTTPATHRSGSEVRMVVMAEYHNNLKDAVIAIETKIGTTGSEEYPRFSSGTTPPASPKIGDIWNDTVNDQFKIFDGSTWDRTFA